MNYNQFKQSSKVIDYNSPRSLYERHLMSLAIKPWHCNMFTKIISNTKYIAQNDMVINFVVNEIVLDVIQIKSII
ncbi:hypothetical protein M153_2080005509 [Pseudoloma neurophilia]|uniref:Uncharacterized protein n=1 Tax=Pseudoloma neurophilia TaxID=146866 RepID=A0A0R0LZ48_9MICR|nr:hypothetical protein M153_2080005509 [Pseudoloma neurophilia]